MYILTNVDILFLCLYKINKILFANESSFKISWSTCNISSRAIPINSLCKNRYTGWSTFESGNFKGKQRTTK